MAKPNPRRAYLESYTAVATRLMLKRPYLASLISAMSPVFLPGRGTWAMDMWGRVYIDPDLIGKAWNMEKCEFVLWHELNHYILLHFERMRPLIEQKLTEAPCVDRELTLALLRKHANVVEDFEINSFAKKERFYQDEFGGAMPEDLGLPPEKLAEEYWEMIPPSVWEAARNSELVWLPEAPDGGSATHGYPMPWEIEAEGSTELPRKIGDLARQMLLDQLAKDIKAAKAAGSVPGYLDRWADERLRPPVIPWQKELWAQVQASLTHCRGQVDYSYSVTNYRNPNFAGVLMPGMSRPAVQAGVVIDTSCSMGSAEITAAVAETSGILSASGQREIKVYSVDAAVAAAGSVRTISQVKLKGGGGTDMGVGIEAAHRDKCRMVVVLTDGFTPWPTQPPAGMKVVVGLIGTEALRSQAREGVPEWARCVEIPVEER